ncbi:LysR substrate binding domain protein [compost metagenome]
MESYHGMLACVTAGAGIAMLPRSMLEALPRSDAVDIYEVAIPFNLIKTWLIWRSGMKHTNVDALLSLLSRDVVDKTKCA